MSSCEVFESWACNRKTPCSVCLRGGNKDHIEACRMERAFEFAAAPVKRGNQFKVEEDAAAMAVPAMGSVMAPFSLGSFVATASLQPFRPLASKLPSNTPVRSIGRRLQNIPVHPLLAVKVLPPIPDKPEATADCSGQPSMWAAVSSFSSFTPGCLRLLTLLVTC